MTSQRQIAYFSMETAVDANVPSISGGLGMLAGDLIRSAADRHVPMVAVTIVARQGYFTQYLDVAANQSCEWRSRNDLGLASVCRKCIDHTLRAGVAMISVCDTRWGYLTTTFGKLTKRRNARWRVSEKVTGVSNI